MTAKRLLPGNNRSRYAARLSCSIIFPISFLQSPSTPTEKSDDPAVRYVLSGQPTGWAAMAEDIKKYDKEKIDDCKEDIDTLMTFVSMDT